MFTVSRQGYVAWRDAGIPAAIAMFALVVALATRVPSTAPELRTFRQYHVITRLVAIVAFIATLIVLGSTWSDYRVLRDAEARGTYRVTSGEIERLVPEGSGGHPPESFDVGGVHFTYASNDVTSAYHRTVPEGGPLRNGMSVRIFDVSGRIVRIDTGLHGSLEDTVLGPRRRGAHP